MNDELGTFRRELATQSQEAARFAKWIAEREREDREMADMFVSTARCAHQEVSV